MTGKTRIFVISSLLVLAVGIGSGLVAYYGAGFSNPFARAAGPDDLRYVPGDSAVIVYADIRELMTSDLGRKLRETLPIAGNGAREFQSATGIDVETDIDRVTAGAKSGGPSSGRTGTGIVLARGRFDAAKIEALMRQHGAHVEDYRGKRLIVGDPGSRSGSQDWTVALVEPGRLMAVGSADAVRAAIDRPGSGRDATSNRDVMRLVRTLDGASAWAVGRADALSASGQLPDAVATQLPAVTWLLISGKVNGGLRAVVQAETKDEEAANNLRDVVRGFVALGRLQAASNPAWRQMMQSVELGGTGKTVAMSFAFSSDALDSLRNSAAPWVNRAGH